MMREVEKTLEVGTRADEFRQDVIAKIGAWSLDHPKAKPVYADIFADYFKKLREAYFGERKKTVRAGVVDLLKYMTGNEKALPAEALPKARTTIENLIKKYGYTEESARDAVQLLARHRYAQ
jgi:serine protein kinase